MRDYADDWVAKAGATTISVPGSQIQTGDVLVGQVGVWNTQRPYTVTRLGPNMCRLTNVETGEVVNGSWGPGAGNWLVVRGPLNNEWGEFAP